MKIHWKALPAKTQKGDRALYETLIFEAWVKDFRIGWINASFFYDEGGDRHFNELSATSAVIKTRKNFATYLGNPVAYKRIGTAAMIGDYTEIQKWVEDQWNSMLQKAGIF